jgi:CheY-like chemotaxis protein
MLVVDDKAVNRRILEERIRSWNASSVSAEGGPQALVALRQAAEAGEPFDVAILDLQMPDMSGVQLAKEIRGWPPSQSLPLVLLTSVDYGEHLASEMFDICLSKPVRAAALEQAVRGLLGSAETPCAETSPRITVRREAAPRGTPKQTIVPDKPAAPLSPPPEPPPVVPGPVSGASGKPRILIADDNAVNLRVVSSLLPSQYEVFIANDGEEAVRLFQSCKPTVVLMDLLMPKLDGIEATEQIRKLPGGATTPIIALSADVVAETVERCREAGMDGHLPKPIQSKELLAMVERLCAPREPESGAAAAGARA